MAIVRRKETGRYRVQVSWKRKDGAFSKINGGDYKTMKEAKEAEAAILCKIDKEANKPVTIYEAAKSYMEFLKTEVRTSTRLNKAKFLRLYIIPDLGNIQVKFLNQFQVEKWKKKMALVKSKKTGKNYSSVYLKDIWEVLHSVFAFSKKSLHIENNILDVVGGFKTNPDSITKEKPLRYWTVDQVKTFLDAFSKRIESIPETEHEFILDNGVRLICAISAYAGLRKGEANALKISNFIDGRYPYIKVETSVSQKTNSSDALKHKQKTAKKSRDYLLTDPKNRSSIRDVQIPKVLSEMIRNQIALLKRVPGCTGDAFICGGVYPLADTTIEYLKDTVEKDAGLPHIRFHDLRHSYVSMLINASVPINVISRMVGHSSPEITWKVYSHIYPKSESEAVDALEKVILK